MNRVSGVSGQMNRMLIAAVALVCAIGAMECVVAQVPEKNPAPTIARDVGPLIDELNAETRARRAEAERRLLEQGPQILPLLPAPELLPTPSVREAVRRIRVELERRQAAESAQASRVTLRGTQNLPQWLDEIRRQTGNEVLVDSSLPAAMRSRVLTLDLVDVDFWPALRKLAHAVMDGTDTEPAVRLSFDDQNRLVMTRSETKSGADQHETYSGAFRVVARPAQRRPIFGRPDRQLVRVELEVAAEPRLRPLFLQLAAADFDARTDAGVSMPPYTPEARKELPLTQGRRTAQWYADFDVPAGWNATTINLRGKAVMTTAAESQPIRFTSLGDLVGNRGAGVARRRGGVTVTLNRILSERNGEADAERSDVRIQAVVGYDTGGPAFESHRTWIIHNEAYLETDKERIPITSQQTTLQADGAVGLEYRFDKLAAPLDACRFVYVAPTLIVDVPIAFELKRIPVR
jgi:hypothetical protein